MSPIRQQFSIRGDGCVRKLLESTLLYGQNFTDARSELNIGRGARCTAAIIHPGFDMLHAAARDLGSLIRIQVASVKNSSLSARAVRGSTPRAGYFLRAVSSESQSHPLEILYPFSLGRLNIGHGARYTAAAIRRKRKLASRRPGFDSPRPSWGLRLAILLYMYSRERTASSESESYPPEILLYPRERVCPKTCEYWFKLNPEQLNIGCGARCTAPTICFYTFAPPHSIPVELSPFVPVADNSGLIACAENSAFPPPKQNEGDVEILTAWRTVVSSPAGTYLRCDPKLAHWQEMDLTYLCSGFTSKAWCDGTMVVIEPEDLRTITDEFTVGRPTAGSKHCGERQDGHSPPSRKYGFLKQSSRQEHLATLDYQRTYLRLSV
ncbi:hypothetical protein B0H17DRAFT_1280593 [Mycena rosella]|uniref:Uncharacterized protein n=1 Tax=Mycena rosella TaxID=1033263 RepID=A0AAD7GIR4_MYCRO|nr:hypothetical protein B0H17DRAFT_1280593 [Mycena rosella]